MLLVNGEKMSKSLGNFKTLREVLKAAPAEAVRFLLIRSHYRSTLDFSDAALLEAKKELDRFYLALLRYPNLFAASSVSDSRKISNLVLDALCDDLNTPSAIAGLHQTANAAIRGDEEAAVELYESGKILGLFNQTPLKWFHGDADEAYVERLIAERKTARAQKNFARADEIRKSLEAEGILLEDTAGGTIWRKI
jgi:cysteinyl-tRNA synthetase